MNTPIADFRDDFSAIFAQIDRFLAALEAQGVRVDIGQRVRLHALLQKLIIEHRLPTGSDRLCNLITPVLATSPAQQVICVATLRSLFAGDLSPASAELNRLHTEPQEAGVSRQALVDHSRFVKALIGGVVALVLSASLYLVLVDLHPKPIVHDFGPPRGSGKIVVDAFKWIKDYPIKELDLPQQAPWNRSWRWFYTEYSAAKWIALLLPCVILIAFLIFLYSQLIAALRREALKQNLHGLDLRLGASNARFGDRRLIGELQPLRKLSRIQFEIFDSEGTVIASSESAGMLRPRYKFVGTSNEFVILLDRRSARDHLAAFNLEVIRCLRSAGLSIETFEFNEEPSLCYSRRSGELIRLAAVIRRFPDSVLLIFAAADQLVDPARGQILPAVQTLKYAHRVVLFTPETATTESRIERALSARLGISILRTTPEGVAELGRLLLQTEERINAGSLKGRSASKISVGELTDYFSERPGRWMQTIAPRLEQIRSLQSHLRHALSSAGLRWLAATAVYPELRWPLTLSLKASLASPGRTLPLLDDELMAVARLPWFRSGWMPDWMRILLGQVLSEEDRHQVRHAVLKAIGLFGLKDQGSNEDIEIDDGGRRKERIRSDGIMLRYILPALLKAQRLFELPRGSVRGIVRKPLLQLLRPAVTALIVTIALSVAGLSLLPIDECDLWAGSLADDFRIGPGNYSSLLVRQPDFARRATVACRQAIQKEPNQGRYWYQLARAIEGTAEAGDITPSLRSAELNYPAGYHSLGYVYFHRGYLIEAERNFKKAVELGNWYSFVGLGDVAFKNGELKKSFDYIKHYARCSHARGHPAASGSSRR
jgi:hypothetical protein